MGAAGGLKSIGTATWHSLFRVVCTLGAAGRSTSIGIANRDCLFRVSALWGAQETQALSVKPFDIVILVLLIFGGR